MAKKRAAVVKTAGGKDGPGVVIEVDEGEGDEDVDALEDDADDDEQA